MADPGNFQPLPSPTASFVDPGTSTISPIWYAYLIGLETRLQLALAGTITPLTDDLETLRVALNETRANPATVYPAVPPFA